MIGVKLQGRLGNQVFQYAFAFITAKKKRQDFFFSSGSSDFLLDYFLLDGFKFNSFKNSIQRILFRLSNFKSKTLYQTGSEITEDVLKEVPFYKEFDGYFQSELFLKGFEDQVRDLFEIKAEYKSEFQKKYKDLFQNNKTIAVHIRRMDYLAWDLGNKFGGTNIALPFSYVETVLKKFNLDDYKVIFISDDITAAKEHFGKNKNFYFETNPEIIDLQILLNADVLCLSNSSFSWWGAYLNSKNNKQVFAPENWLGFKTGIEHPANIICNGWHKVPVTNGPT